MRDVERRMVRTPKYQMGDMLVGESNALTIVKFNVAKTNPENAEKVILEMHQFFGNLMGSEIKNKTVVNRIVSSVDSKRVYRYL